MNILLFIHLDWMGLTGKLHIVVFVEFSPETQLTLSLFPYGKDSYPSSPRTEIRISIVFGKKWRRSKNAQKGPKSIKNKEK